jgi:hypothetical protein
MAAPPRNKIQVSAYDACQPYACQDQSVLTTTRAFHTPRTGLADVSVESCASPVHTGKSL